MAETEDDACTGTIGEAEANYAASTKSYFEIVHRLQELQRQNPNADTTEGTIELEQANADLSKTQRDALYAIGLSTTVRMGQNSITMTVGDPNNGATASRIEAFNHCNAERVNADSSHPTLKIESPF